MPVNQGLAQLDGLRAPEDWRCGLLAGRLATQLEREFKLFFCSHTVIFADALPLWRNDRARKSRGFVDRPSPCAKTFVSRGQAGRCFLSLGIRDLSGALGACIEEHGSRSGPLVVRRFGRGFVNTDARRPRVSNHSSKRTTQHEFFTKPLLSTAYPGDLCDGPSLDRV